MTTIQVKSLRDGGLGTLTWSQGKDPTLKAGTLDPWEAGEIRRVMSTPYEIAALVEGQLDGGELETFRPRDSHPAFMYAVGMLVAQAGVVQIRKAPAK